MAKNGSMQPRLITAAVIAEWLGTSKNNVQQLIIRYRDSDIPPPPADHDEGHGYPKFWVDTPATRRAWVEWDWLRRQGFIPVPGGSVKARDLPLANIPQETAVRLWQKGTVQPWLEDFAELITALADAGDKAVTEFQVPRRQPTGLTTDVVHDGFSSNGYRLFLRAHAKFAAARIARVIAALRLSQDDHGAWETRVADTLGPAWEKALYRCRTWKSR